MEALTVQEVIDMLQAIEDKNKKVYCELDSYSIREINGFSFEGEYVVL